VVHATLQKAPVDRVTQLQGVHLRDLTRSVAVIRRASFVIVHMSVSSGGLAGGFGTSRTDIGVSQLENQLVACPSFNIVDDRREVDHDAEASLVLNLADEFKGIDEFYNWCRAKQHSHGLHARSVASYLTVREANPQDGSTD
jgi:hypothetical protein